MSVEGVELQHRSFLSSAVVKVSGQPHAPADLFPRKEPQVTLARRLSGKHTRSGVSEKRKILLHLPGFLTRIVQPISSLIRYMICNCYRCLMAKLLPK